MPSGQIVDALTDMQVPLDEDGNYTIVYSRKEDRPANATAENGVAWIEWSPRGEGIDGPKNRPDFGMLMLRIIANSPSWKQSPNNVTEARHGGGRDGAVLSRAATTRPRRSSRRNGLEEVAETRERQKPRED